MTTNPALKLLRRAVAEHVDPCFLAFKLTTDGADGKRFPLWNIQRWRETLGPSTFDDIRRAIVNPKAIEAHLGHLATLCGDRL